MLKDESIGLGLNNTVYVKTKSCPDRRCWLLWIQLIVVWMSAKNSHPFSLGNDELVCKPEIGGLWLCVCTNVGFQTE